MFYKDKLQAKHFFKVSELSRHIWSEMNLKYTELFGIC